MDIEKLRIQNYKGIKDLHLDFKSLNILVGQNNTGKSTILSAISLALSPFHEYTNESSIFKSFSFDTSPLRYLFNDENSPIHIELQMHTEILSLTIQKYSLEHIVSKASALYKYKKEMIDRIANKELERNKYDQKIIDLNDESRAPEELFTDYWEIRKNELGEKFDLYLSNSLLCRWEINQTLLIEAFFDSENLVRALQPSFRFNPRADRKLMNLFFIKEDFPETLEKFVNTNSDISIHSGMTGELFDSYKVLFKNNKNHDLNEFLRKKIRDLSDIVIFGDEIYVTLMNSVNELTNLPLNSMGQGFKTLFHFSILLYFTNNFVLFEEPENFLHPGYMNILSEEIEKSLLDKQFFLTTHSMEFIENMNAILSTSTNKSNIQIIRLLRENDEIDREILNFKDIEYELKELKVDLRGI